MKRKRNFKANYIMRFEDYINEDYYIETLTNWQIQRQFYSFIDEIVDTNVKLSIKGNKDDFITTFFHGDIKYVFHAKLIQKDGGYGILFYPVDGDSTNMFGNKKGTSYIGTVLSGIFRSLKALIDKHKVISFEFNTDDKDLISLYNRMIPWIEKRFNDFEFSGKQIKGNKANYKYIRKL